MLPVLAVVVASNSVDVSSSSATRWTLLSSPVKAGPPVSGGGTDGAAIACGLGFSQFQVS